MIHTHITHTHRDHCSAVLPQGPVITEAETDERVAPLSSSILLSSPPNSSPDAQRSPLPTCLSELFQSLINGKFKKKKQPILHQWEPVPTGVGWMAPVGLKSLTLTFLGPKESLRALQGHVSLMNSDQGVTNEELAQLHMCWQKTRPPSSTRRYEVQDQVQRFFGTGIQGIGLCVSDSVLKG